MDFALKALGPSVGLLLQNDTMVSKIMNHHVIPGRRISGAQLGTAAAPAELTRANETLWFTRDGCVSSLLLL